MKTFVMAGEDYPRWDFVTQEREGDPLEISEEELLWINRAIEEYDKVQKFITKKMWPDRWQNFFSEEGD